MADGAGERTEDGDEVGVGVGVGVALTVGLAFRDERGELVTGRGLVGVTVGVYVGVATVAGLVPVPVEELVGAGLIQSQKSRVTTKMPIRAQVEVRIRCTRRISHSPPARKG